MRIVTRSVVFVATALATAAGLPAGAAWADRPAPPGRILLVDDRPGEGAKSIRAAGGDLRTLELPLTRAGHPDYSPDGTRITYADGWGIYTARADGTNRVRMLEAGSVPAFPRWSPRGDEIAFEAGVIEVAQVGAPGARRQVGGDSSTGPLTVAWSPDGRRVAMVRSWMVGGEPWDPIFERDIWIAKADGSGTARRLTNRASWDPYRLAWSPDGRTLAVEAQADLWSVRVATGAVSNLTATPDVVESSPVFSRDGRWLAYGRRTAEAAPQVWLRRTGGPGPGRAAGATGEPTSWH